MGKCYYNNNTIEKLQKTDSSREFLKIENEQIKARFQTILMDTKMPEITNLCVEIMNIKRQVKGKLDHFVQIYLCRLTFHRQRKITQSYLTSLLVRI